MNMKVVWQGKRRFEATGDSEHSVVMDAKPDIGGENKGPRPMEMLLMGIGGCTGIDMTMILEKMRYTIEEFDIQINADRADTEPQRFTTIRMNYRIKGDGIDPAKVERAIRLSAEKYCSAAASVHAVYEHTFELNGISYTVASK